KNPPSIPTLPLMWLVGWIQASKVVIDQHNLGHSIVALKLGHGHPFVVCNDCQMEVFGHSAYACLFITWAIGRMAILYNHPPSHFNKCLPSKVHELFICLGPSLNLTDFLPKPNIPYSAEFMMMSWPSHESCISSQHLQINTPTLCEDRVTLLVSSTSWMPDKDFDTLLEALKLYEERAQALNDSSQSSLTEKLLKVWMVITGKGPLHFRQLARLQEMWVFIRCSSLWLEATNKEENGHSP
ncbi:hypothetical protein F5141DRAFT_1008734, partial [Pisolithus sp. B1]